METNVWKFVYKYVKQLKWTFIILGFIIVLGLIAMRSQNWLIAQIIGLISEKMSPSEISRQILFFLSMCLVANVIATALDACRRLLLEGKIVPYFNLKIAADLFTATHKHSLSFFNEEMAGNVSGKVREVVNKVENFYLHLFFGIFQPFVSMAVSLGFIFYVNVGLGWCFVGLNFSFMILTVWLKKKITPYAQRRAKLKSESNGMLVDTITNAELLKSFANFLYERCRYFCSLKKLAKAEIAESRKTVKLDWIGRFVFDIMNVLCLAITIYYWYKHNLSVADVVLVASFANNFVNAVSNIGYFASSFASIYGTLKDGLELLGKPCEVVNCSNAQKLQIKKPEINFSKVMYHYKSSKPLFKNFNLQIAAGEKIGLVGHSGSGKSTLIKILSRYYDIQDGQILIDGQNIAKVTQDSLRSQISLIPQDTTLFNRTIMENIRYGNLKATDKQVIAASKKAFCHDFIKKLPNGYESKVGERGVMLSGGERQRIAIARAILKNSPILILDEATSALDSDSEKYIQEALAALMKGKTVIAIAHRLSTLRQMDRLIVLDKGKIIESGQHQELIAGKGEYYHFYQMQTEGFLQIDK